MNLEEIKLAMTTLTHAELEKLYDWLDKHCSQLFDARIQTDAGEGRLDDVILRHLADERAGSGRPL